MPSIFSRHAYNGKVLGRVAMLWGFSTSRAQSSGSWTISGMSKIELTASGLSIIDYSRYNLKAQRKIVSFTSYAHIVTECLPNDRMFGLTAHGYRENGGV